MRSHKRDQAAVSVIVPKGGIRGNDGAQAGGLMGRESIASAVSCAIARCRAILSVLVRMNGRRRGNLPTSTRRTIAASRLARGVSFGGSSNHGVIAYALLGVRGAVGPAASVCAVFPPRTACPPRGKGAQFYRLYTEH